MPKLATLGKRSPKKGSYNKGIQFRMPKNDSKEYYYSLSVRREAFDTIKDPDRKIALVYIGRIKETDNSKARPEGRYTRYVEKDYSPYLVYKAAAIKQYSVRRCSRCTYDRKLYESIPT